MTLSIHPKTDLRVAAFFDKPSDAYMAANLVKQGSSVKTSDISVIAPKDNSFNQKLEGDSAKLGREMLKSHLIWGGAGLLLGALSALLLVLFGPEFTQQNPIFTFIALISPGLFTGLFMSGLLTLRPDHDPVTQSVRTSAQRGDWSVVVHLSEWQQREDVIPLLEAADAKKIA